MGLSDERGKERQIYRRGERKEEKKKEEEERMNEEAEKRELCSKQANYGLVCRRQRRRISFHLSIPYQTGWGHQNSRSRHRRRRRIFSLLLSFITQSSITSSSRQERRKFIQRATNRTRKRLLMELQMRFSTHSSNVTWYAVQYGTKWKDPLKFHMQKNIRYKNCTKQIY